MTNRIIITGCAGFIGMHLAKACLVRGMHVLGIDNVSPYYDVALKEARLKHIGSEAGFTFLRADITDKNALNTEFMKFKGDMIIHLAAQPGIRHSFDHPEDYIQSNIVGTFNIFEMAKEHNISNVLYASSSSVYGGIEEDVFKTDMNVNKPLNLYAASKATCELMAHSYAHLYDITMTGLRFFTVYGPWGRPDMAVYHFTDSIIKGKPIKLFNSGDMLRDFTYIDDIVEGILRLCDSEKLAGHTIFNIGKGHPENVLTLLQSLERILDIKAGIVNVPFQAGEMYSTYADTRALEDLTGFKPQISLDTGLESFINWYKSYR